MDLDSFINGHPTSAPGDARLVCVSPIDGVTVVGSVASASAEQVRAAIAAASSALPAWAEVPVRARVEQVQTAIAEVLAVGAQSGQLIAAEMGKPAGEADGEFAFAERYARFCGDQAEAICAEHWTEDEEGTLLRVAEPMGVIAAITPWNAPVILAALKVIPALMTGNTMVLKPSPLAPLAVTSFLSDVAARLPAGVLNLVNGGPEAGDALVSDPRVDMISFTGGPATARAIGAAAARSIRPTVMELGGNDAAIILEDAEWGEELAERIIFGAFLTSGQVCMAIKRVYVPRSHHDAFVNELVQAAQRVLRVGDPREEGVTMGPVISADARERLERLVDSSARAGGTVIEIGSIDDALPTGGHWMRPRLVTGLDDDHELVRDEQFGPVLPILAYDTVDEAIERANSVEHGLASSVWSKDADRARDVARRLRVGFTFINCANRAGVSLRAPMGGRGLSGHGREFGDLGLSEYVQNHSINYPRAAHPGSRMAANRYPVLAVPPRRR
ncbi:acyl-CoA reductase-like NAD-dependent aldehyde dehydrogenase [Glaciihabitans tibetensis]|uniref:aldehyde dehydrogenase (NAD(+)) n=1 Tax=Glaciihabitans tibetensis TaxID=1266600 RepID=A0A2T0VDV4_9MICO|nr:aldehyde dehydrogenase family protein [Glaciihabitans tibetensis]PRY68364.1 acyl-CoA reductase-like NAD-dependent aldehyde dehydrogenase [Glaciihabitans tibetensis]